MTTVAQIPITRQAPLLLRPEEACVKCGHLSRFCDRQGLCPGCQGRALERELGFDAGVRRPAGAAGGGGTVKAQGGALCQT